MNHRTTMKVRFFILLLLLAILSWACQSHTKSIPVLDPTFTAVPVPTLTPALPSPTPFVRIFDIYPDRPRQTITHLGSGNFIHYFGGVTSATDPHSALNLKLLQPKFARVSIELQEWEPVNDNSDPAQMDATAFKDDQHNHATFELMKILQSQGVELTATVWRVPDWMVEDPKIESPRTIAHNMYPEAIESIAAWLLHAKEQYGVEVAYVSFNEANLGVTVQLTPDDYAEMIRIGGKRFMELGLKTKWLLGDCSSIGGCLDYVKGIYAAQDIHSYLGPLAFHNWDGANVGDDTITALGDWAGQQGLETRCTEGGWDAQLWQRMELLMQMNNAFPPGTQVIETSPNGDTVVIVAGKQPSGKLVVHMVSITTTESIVLRGLPDGSYNIYISNREEINQLPQTITVADGAARFEMPGFGVALFIQK